MLPYVRAVLIEIAKISITMYKACKGSSIIEFTHIAMTSEYKKLVFDRLFSPQDCFPYSEATPKFCVGIREI